MSEAEFRSIVTSPCEVVMESSYEGFHGVQLRCHGIAEFSAAIVGIQNGKVTFLSQIGLGGGFG